MCAAGAQDGLDPARLFSDIVHEPAIGIAVSGGPDSLALMVLYARWAETGCAPPAIVYTLDHQLRPEAQSEVALVAELATNLGLDARILHWDAPKPAAGIQARARSARYRLIGEAMEADGATVLLTGHHQKDQAETILMRMAHGSGVSGLRGMQRHARVEGVRVFRPMLTIAPEALGSVVRGAGLSAVSDPSNSDASYERVRWRQSLAQFAALGLTEERLALLGTRLARVDALANAQSRAFLARAVSVDTFGAYWIERDALANAPDEVAIRALCAAIDAAGGENAPGLGQVEAIWEALGGQSEFSGRTLAGAKIEQLRGNLAIYREAERIGEPPLHLSSGLTQVWDGRFAITAQRPGLTVSPARSITRKRLAMLMDHTILPPMDAVRAAPLIHDEEGRVLAIGRQVFGAGVVVEHMTLTSPA